jgi:signal transduction histidine kinase
MTPIYLYLNYKMVTVKKIRWIPFLMIVSQAMLTAFVGYWLTSQYQDEKKLMQEELTRIYHEAQSQVIDSLLFARVVAPALNDSVTVTMMTTIDTTPMRSGHADFQDQPSAAYVVAEKKQDLLIRSVKLIINHSGDSVARDHSFPGMLPGYPDTAMLRKVYAEKVGQKKPGIKITWNPGSGDEVNIIATNDTTRPRIQFTRFSDGPITGLEIGNDAPYLIRQISPQILFALILLLLTGSAFYFTNRSLKRQILLNSLRDDFVSNITHELKTPVSTVKVAIEALKTFDKVKDPAITREYLDMAGQEMNRLDQLISKVLDQSIIGEQNRVIQPQLSSIKDLTEMVLLTLQPRLISRGATIHLDSPDSMEPVMVDPLHFQGVLNNLIDNSLKYGPENPSILIRIWESQNSVFIEVSDNGPGIPKVYLGRVFDKFFRVPSGNTHNIKGYGLGLSFAALVMMQHEGAISVKNNDQGGCVFTLRFPAKTI